MSEYEYDYDRIVEDSDELYEDDFYDNDYDIEEDFSYWDNYYHNVADELIDE